jgi:hypothetical protein
LLFNVERLYAPLNIASVVYVLAAVSVLVVLLWPNDRKAGLAVLLAAAAVALVLVKLSLGYPIGRSHLPITVTEYAAIAISILLARRVAAAIEEFEQATLRSMTSHLVDRSQAFQQGQADLYREVRRARQHRRPLSLLIMAPLESPDADVLDRFTTEAIRKMGKRYVTARLADLLSRKLKDCDLISEQNGRFVVLLPETRAKRASAVSMELQRLAQTELNLKVKIGHAVFPDDEVTLVRLLDRAEAIMRGEELPDPVSLPASPRKRPGEHAQAVNGTSTAVNGSTVNHLHDGILETPPTKAG